MKNEDQGVTIVIVVGSHTRYYGTEGSRIDNSGENLQKEVDIMLYVMLLTYLLGDYLFQTASIARLKARSMMLRWSPP